MALVRAAKAGLHELMHAFGYVTVASALHDDAAVEVITGRVRSELDRIGGSGATAPEDRPDAPFAILVGTGGTEAEIIELVGRRRVVAPFEPVLLVAHPLHNSLPAALEAMARVQADGGRGRIVQVGTDGTDSLATAVTDVSAIHRLRATRLGLVGEPSPWLVASVPDAGLLRERWGVELVPIDIADTIAAHHHVRTAEAQHVAVRFAHSASPSQRLVDAAKLHSALLEAIEAADVDAITVRCFDYLSELSTSGCVGLAELNDSGVVAGCEGDVSSAVGMLLVRALLGQPSWMANPADLDGEHGRLLLAHCTVAPSLVEEVELHTHFESGLGVGLRGLFAPGPVTLLRLGGRALEKYWIADGEIEHAGSADELCRTQAFVRTDSGAVQSLLDAPLGNHLLLVHGHHRDRIQRWWRTAFG